MGGVGSRCGVQLLRRVTPAQLRLFHHRRELSSIDWVGYKCSCAYSYISMSSISGVFVTKPAPVVIAGVYINLNRPFFVAHAFNIRTRENFLPSINTIVRRAVIGIHRVKPVGHSNTRLFFVLLSFLPCVITWGRVTSC